MRKKVTLQTLEIQAYKDFCRKYFHLQLRGLRSLLEHNFCHIVTPFLSLKLRWKVKSRQGITTSPLMIGIL